MSFQGNFTPLSTAPITSGSVGNTNLGSGAVQSGNIASGAVGPFALASGIIVNAAGSFLMPCVENISGGILAVSITSGSFLCMAQAGSGLRLPAVGVVASNYLSGNVCQVITQGNIQTALASGWSGQSPGFLGGSPLYCGSGGMLVTLSGANGGIKSGYAYQRIGVPFSGGLIVNPEVVFTSGPASTPFAAPAQD